MNRRDGARACGRSPADPRRGGSAGHGSSSKDTFCASCVGEHPGPDQRGAHCGGRPTAAIHPRVPRDARRRAGRQPGERPRRAGSEDSQHASAAYDPALPRSVSIPRREPPVNRPAGHRRQGISQGDHPGGEAAGLAALREFVCRPLGPIEWGAEAWRGVAAQPGLPAALAGPRSATMVRVQPTRRVELPADESDSPARVVAAVVGQRLAAQWVNHYADGPATAPCWTTSGLPD